MYVACCLFFADGWPRTGLRASILSMIAPVRKAINVIDRFGTNETARPTSAYPSLL